MQGATGLAFSGGQGELLPPLSQVLSLDLIAEQKYARQLELRRASIAAMGMAGEMHGNLLPKPLEQQGLDELKRIKVSLFDNAVKARERSRGLSEALMKVERYRAAIQTRKRARIEALGHERVTTSLPGERTASAAMGGKPSFVPSSMPDGNTTKSDDKSKSAVRNKRVRTSMHEGRLSTSSHQRSSILADRDRDALKPNNSPVTMVQEKDRFLPCNVEAREKTTIKGKRSNSIAMTPTSGAFEGEREHKWGAHHRSNGEVRCRPSEGHGFRSGPVHGIVSMHKGESAQPNIVPMRCVNKSEFEGSPSLGERGERSGIPEKERSLQKNAMKLLHKEEGLLPSPIAVAKAKPARAPRSSSGVSANASSHSSRPSPTVEASHRQPGRPHLPVGPSNRKRPAQSRPASPPVAQWVGQRPQKMARSARKNPVLPVGPIGGPLGGREEVPAFGEGNLARDSTTDEGSKGNPSMPAAAVTVKKFTKTISSSLHKSKADRLTPSTGHSDSDDSEVGDVKLKEKWRKQGDCEIRLPALNNLKMGPLVLQSKKSCVKEDGGADQVPRQGRSSRGAIAVRENPSVTLIDKVDPNTNAKQLRSGRPGLEKLEKPNDIKPGRPPSKKGSGDRRTLTRPRQPVMTGLGDGSGESDEDREELVAAVHAAMGCSGAACSSDFWKEVEPYFSYLTPEELEILRRQARELEEVSFSLTSINKCDKGAMSSVLPVVMIEGKVTESTDGSMDVDGSTVSRAFNILKEKQASGPNLIECWPDRGLPLSQRLLAALIVEDDPYDASRKFGSQQGNMRDMDTNCPSDSEHGEMERKDHDSESEVEMKRVDGSNKGNGWVKSPSCDTMYTSNGLRPWDSDSEILNSPAKSETVKEDERVKSYANGVNNCDFRYQSLKLDDRIALELQSVDLYPDLTDIACQEEDEVSEELKKSHGELNDQIHTNKGRMLSLERAVSERRSYEESEREGLAMSKLVEIAFNKRLGHRGSMLGSFASKNSLNKGARAAALMFAKRTLARWAKFKETGRSCFLEAGLRDNLLCMLPKAGNVKALTNSGNVRIDIIAAGLHCLNPVELKQAASEGAGQLFQPCGMEKTFNDSSESVQPATRPGDQEDACFFRPRDREVFLEEVVENGSLGIGGTKGKRSERERDIKSQSKEFVAGRGDSTKCARQGLRPIKGERKTKTKPRQKTGLLVRTVNGLLGKPNEGSLEKAEFVKAKEEVMLVDRRQREAEGTIDLTSLQIPNMEDLGGQNQDLGSWLDFEDPTLPDAGGDFMGLDVPMDDLADLTMMM